MAKNKPYYGVNVRKEAINTLRTNIQFSSIDHELKVIGITSAVSGEGKTAVISELANSFALTGQKVLLINCDMRKVSNTLAKHKKARFGITNILMKKVDIHEAIVKVDDYYYLDSGPIPPNPAELLGSRLMSELIENLKQRYDIIFIDTPPLGLFSDALVLNNSIDGYLLAVAAGETKKEQFEALLDHLDQTKVHVIGIVMTMLEMPETSYGHYAEYGKATT